MNAEISMQRYPKEVDKINSKISGRHFKNLCKANAWYSPIRPQELHCEMKRCCLTFDGIFRSFWQALIGVCGYITTTQNCVMETFCTNPRVTPQLCEKQFVYFLFHKKSYCKRFSYWNTTLRVLQKFNIQNLFYIAMVKHICLFSISKGHHKDTLHYEAACSKSRFDDVTYVSSEIKAFEISTAHLFSNKILCNFLNW